MSPNPVPSLARRANGEVAIIGRFVENFEERVVSISDMTARPLTELLDCYGPALVLFARQWCNSPEDAVQVAFCRLAAQKVWPRDAAAWLFQVVRRAAIDAGKADRRRARREAATARPVRWFEQSEVEGLDVEAAMRALESLPAEEREVIVARLWGGMTLEQVATTVSCSISTAHRRYESGIQRLRSNLGVEKLAAPK